MAALRRIAGFPALPRAALSLPLAAARPYHSYDHPATKPSFNQTETAILSAAYAHVPELGFTQEALGRGARDVGYSDMSTTALQDGLFSLIRYHLVTRREGLAARSADVLGAEGEGQASQIVDRVERLTWERLIGNRDVIHKWQEALAVMAQPSYVPASLKELSLLADEIWFLAGDKAVDPTWYTKRASLSAIYASSELFMTTDRSADFAETRAFLGRRLEETQKAGSVLGAVGEWVGFTASAGVNVLRSKGVRI
ncbi:related to COQ9 Protein required for the biosynthesis of coenzyme Q [Cephalotrichum gorgonifer]|uniref:Ubiquinone biosynthesis protein n=1 Tax=Cephalotrichum gorgonifer TaxID=2041049 RepID=A0AAE8MXL5_9PEZI|nr:related to COQ9 Protein required for the biosynthesis of coenzyme Q [Cephalotrichum gorgonifer]